MKVAIISLIYVLGSILIILLYNRFKTARKMGTILMSYVLGIILSLSGIMDFEGLQKIDMANIQD